MTLNNASIFQFLWDGRNMRKPRRIDRPQHGFGSQGLKFEVRSFG